MNKNLGRFLSLILRHKPQTIGLKLDNNGWAEIDDIIRLSGRPMSVGEIQKVVEQNDKKRFTLSADKRRIRANQGHSISVDVELNKAVPPDVLIHGTAQRFLQSIVDKGLLRRNRLHVHLSKSREAALVVGKRHGKPVIFAVDSKAMHGDGFQFYLSENDVWLVDHVPPKYLRLIDTSS